MAKGVNIHIYQSTFTHASRILRITKTLRDHRFFDRIYVIARHEEGLPERENIDDDREVWRIRTTLGRQYQGLWKLLVMLEWYVRVPMRTRKLKVACINCHSLVVLPLCVLLKCTHGCQLIYDTHELETETTNLSGLRKRVSKLVERILIRFADKVIVVTDSIGKWYRTTYQLDKVTVVKNTPLRPRAYAKRSFDLKDKLGVPYDNQLFIYQGSLGHDRGIEMLLNVFSTQATNKDIVFVGFGPFVDEIKRHAHQNPNIHFHDAVAPTEIASITSGADVGIALLANTSLNHYFCLGNKVFEYLQNGLPIIVSDFPEMSGLVSKHGCGWIVDVDDKQSVANLISRITWRDIRQRGDHAASCRGNYVWENEEPELIQVYQWLAASA